MNDIHLLAQSLNDQIASSPNRALEFFSRRGRGLYFPFKGILGQSAEAKACPINATIGTALEEDGSPLALESIENLMCVPHSALLYAPSFGIQELREAWKLQMLKKNPLLDGLDFSLPVVTCALTHALFLCGQLFVDEDDEIILPDLSWDNYELIFKNGFGAKLKHYPTFSSDGGYNVQGLLDAAKASGPTKKKIILLNFPNNPTGYTVTESEAFAIKDALFGLAEEGYRLLVILDDAYFGLVYEKGVFAQSLFPLLANLHENILALKLDGPTKEDYVWSLRIGFISFAIKAATPAQLKAFEAKAAGAIRGTVSNCSGIAQAMLLKAYSSPSYEKEKAEKFKTLQARYRRIKEILAAHPEYAENFIPMPFNSGYFMCVKVVGADPESVRKRLISSYGTGVIVISGLLRIAFSSVPCQKLDGLFANINKAVCEVKNI